MATKLDWQYDDHSGEYHAEVPGHRIRAVRDEDAQNPFEDGDCNWPIVVRNGERGGDRFTSYAFGEKQRTLACPFELFNDALLIHWQIHIAKAFSTTIPAMIECYGQSEDALVGTVVCRDGAVLREVMTAQWEDWSDSAKLDLAVELLKMADVVAVCKTVTGYSQGDWAEVLVVATPEAIEKFGCAAPIEATDLEGTADLYGYWAWGDVYGHIVERIEQGPAACVRCDNTDNDGSDVCTDCGDEMEDPEPEFIELDDGACWGFYGNDFEASGLEESALCSVPETTPERELEDA